jgi:hypothetical protein
LNELPDKKELRTEFEINQIEKELLEPLILNIINVVSKFKEEII